MSRRIPAISDALGRERYIDVMREIVALAQPVDRFFTDVMVMVDDSVLREARLTLLSRLKEWILRFADPSAIGQEDTQA